MMKSMIKYSFRSLLSLVLMLMMVTSVMASQPPSPSTYGNLYASFTTSGYTNPISVSDLTLKDSLTSQAVTALYPKTDYKIGFTVADLDGLSGMNLKVVLYNDPDGDFNPTTADATTLNGNEFVFVWNQAGVATGGTQNPTLVNWVDYDPGESWAIVNSNQQDAFYIDSNPSSFNFVFEFKTSDIAVASTTWKLYVEVATNEATPDEASISLEQSLTMAWNGSMQLLANTDMENHPLLSWGEIAYNAQYASTKTNTTVKYFSNGAFDTYASAGETWFFYEANNVGGVDGSVTLSTNPTADKTFGIRINTNDYSFDTSSGGSVSGYKQVSTSWITVESNLARTSEAGVEKWYYFYLQLGSGFQNGTYSGTVAMGISNHIDIVE